MKKKVIPVIIVIAAVIALVYVYSAKNAVRTLSFEDKELGLSFRYPEEFGLARIEIIGPGHRPGGETGEKLAGTFASMPSLEFGGITEDFSAGRSGLLTDTRGFSKKDGTYFFKFVASKPEYEIRPLKVIEKEFGEILILDDQSFEAERDGAEGPVLGVGSGRLAGLVNLKSDKFTGIVFHNWDIEILPLSEFERFLSSIEVMEPQVPKDKD